jgi:hypothetical protein
MARIPKVTVTFDADLASLKTGVKNATTDVDSFSDRVSDFGKKAALAFAAAGAAIGAFAIASVKAAAEDEVGQKKLEETIRNTTNATADQIKGIDKYITRQSIATNTTDDILRPALSRLILATKDVTKAQELLSLAQEISLARNKPLEAVTNALGKAYEGSNTALGKLGIGISKATLATGSFDEIQTQLNATFTGFIENQADTAAFKFGQIKIAVDESKEAIGAALLPVVKELADFLIVTVVPAIEGFVAGLTGKDGLEEGLTESQLKAVEWGKKVRSVIDTVIDLKDELIAVAVVIGTVFVVSKISAAVVATIALINTLIKAYNLLKASAIVAGVATAFALNPLLGVGAVALAAGVLAGANALARSGDTPGAETFAVGGAPGAISGGSKSTGSTTVSGGGVSSGGGVAAAVKTAATATKAITGAFTDSQNAARLAAQGGGGFTDSQNAARLAAQGGITINVNAPSIIDEEAFSRATANALNNSTFRGTNGAANLVYL